MKKFQTIEHEKNYEYHKPRNCKYCREWYKDTIRLTKKLVKDRENRKMLLAVWETLWLNNCSDFDIIEGVMENWVRDG